MKKKIIIINVILTIIVFISLFFFIDKSYTVPVLMYHSINIGSDSSSLIVSPDTFIKQIKFLKDRNFQFMSLADYVELLKSGKKPRRKSIVITFDDGYEDNYIYAFPILKELNIPATVFIVTDWVNNENMLNWSQIKEMKNSNLVEIGSHSITHDMLTEMPKAAMIREVSQSKQILEKTLDVPVRFFGYPTGAHSEFIKEMTKIAGYKAACATSVDKRTAHSDLFAIRRIRISHSADNLFIFGVQVSGYYNFLKDRRIKKGKWRKY
ncbi:MAG: polysaccharide deacetylase family protein [Candidatus Omnitrophica bacterium]|nr:polysaccharide deacetylase family protein [Candidatus Omnitrophota bacterium]